MENIDLVQDIVKLLCKSLVDTPENLTFSSVTDSSGNLSIIIYLGGNHAGQLIGKMGRIANAMRTLVKAIGKKNRLKSVYIDIQETVE